MFSWIRCTGFSHYIWAIAVIRMNDPFGQPCRDWVFFNVSCAVWLSFRSQYSEFFMVILYSRLCLSEIVMPSIQEFLIIGLLDSCSVLSEFSLSLVFWRNSVMQYRYVYYRFLVKDSFMPCGTLYYIMDFYGFPEILYYGFQHYGFLGILSALLRSPKEQTSVQYYYDTVRGYIWQ